MTIIEQLGLAGIVPVVVIEKEQDALPTADAFLKGGLNVMEITMRTEAGIESIRQIKRAHPDMIIGAGTVLTLDKCKECVSVGADFIVSPGYDEEIVAWCVKNGISVTPGCVTPSEITQALKHDLKVLKFFPANVYGGLTGMKGLHGPFGNVTFLPTGGVNLDNLVEYVTQPYIHAVGGSWLCNKADISAGNFEKITGLVRESIDRLLGFEVAHIGINAANEEEADKTAKEFSDMFGFEYKNGNSSIFAGKGIEVNKSAGIGKNGHIAIRTNSIPRAAYYLKKKGFEVNMATAKEKGGKLVAVYLNNEVGSFGIHLLQK